MGCAEANVPVALPKVIVGAILAFAAFEGSPADRVGLPVAGRWRVSPSRTAARRSLPFCSGRCRQVTSELTDKRRTNDQGLAAASGDQACDLR
jgi:hypothetical protein